MSVIEYRNLLYEVSEKIAWITERRRLLFICKIFLPDGCENNIQDVLSLLIKLEEENQLGIDSLEVLKDLLERMGKWSLLQIVEKFENKRKEYKRLLEQCGRVLDECSQLERLLSLCEGKISRDRQEHITDVWTLFTELERQNNLGIKRLDILKTMVTEMEKPNLLEQVEEFEKRRKQEEDAEREQNELEEARRRSQAQAAAVLASARYAGGRLIGIVTPHCTFRNVAGGIVAVTTLMILRRSSSLEEFVSSFTEAVLPLGNTLRAISEGSLCFTVQAQTTLALEALWKRYQDGTLQRNLQEFLVTEEIKQLEDSEVMLTVKIDEQEYNNAVWDLIITETQELEVREEKIGFEDQASSDPAHVRVREAHPGGREEVLRDNEFNLPERIAFVEEYLANLQETYSMTAETTDSGLWSQSAPSESGFNKDRGDIQEILERVDEWMKEVSEKLDILTEPRGGANKDEDILDNIQQIRKEMENIRETLDTLEKPQVLNIEAKYRGSGLTKRIWRALRTRKRKPTHADELPPQRSKEPIEDILVPGTELLPLEPWTRQLEDPSSFRARSIDDLSVIPYPSSFRARSIDDLSLIPYPSSFRARSIDDLSVIPYPSSFRARSIDDLSVIPYPSSFRARSIDDLSIIPYPPRYRTRSKDDLSDIPGSDVDPVTERHCFWISPYVGGHWKRVLRSLSMDEKAIRNLDEDFKHCKVAEKCYQGLLVWKESLGPQKATIKKLYDALQTVGCSEALKALQEDNMSQS